MKIRFVSVFAVVALIGCTVFGCSSSNDAASTAAAGNCPAVGSKACPNDTAIDQTSADACVKSKSDAKCGSAYTDVLKCAGNNAPCGTDGKVDSSKFATACKTQYEAYTKCVTPPTPGADAG